MNPWLHVYYADGDYAAAMAASFLAQVDDLSRRSPGAAVYCWPESAGQGLHYYFTPEAHPVGRRFRGEACTPPALAQLLTARPASEPRA